MTKTKQLLMCFVLITSVIMSSCSKKDDTPDPDPQLPKGSLTVTLNGSGFSNVTMTFNTTGVAVLEAGYTGCEFIDAQNNVAVVGFTGASTGTYVINEETSDDNNLVISLDNGTTIIGLSTGSVIVTGFGITGQEITGTVSGTGFISRSGNEPTEIELKNCSFSATRLTK